MSGSGISLPGGWPITLEFLPLARRREARIA
jgi:hypothetical protein